jgi:hypothetical protein
MTDEDTCEKFHLSFERFVPPSFLFREKVSPLYFKKQTLTKVHEAWLTPYEGWDFISLKKLFGMKLCGF